jgi:uncharacterized protein YkwD
MMGDSTVIRPLRSRVALAFAGVAALSAAFVALLVAGTPSAATNCTPDGSWPGNNGSYASQVVSLVNQHRASIGLGSLGSSSTLQAAAVWKARHMARYQ